VNDIDWTNPYAIWFGVGCGVGYWLIDWWVHRDD
jgi:hypothetical protein